MNLLLFGFVLVLVSFCEANLKLGISHKRSTTRIAGGNVAEAVSRPYQAALYIRWDTEEIVFCGGALITQSSVLTAAHCLTRGAWYVNTNEGDIDEGNVIEESDRETAGNIDVILGAYSLYDRYEAERRVYRGVEVIVHPDYNSETFQNDIAIIQLAANAEVSDSIQIIGLPWLNTTSYSFTGRAATVSGWGIPAAGVPYIAPMLREKSLTVISDTQCNNFYFNLLPNNIICAYQQNAGTCQGDNGSPLTITRENGDGEEEDFLVGITSAIHISGCNTEHPSLFTRVQNYLDWIQLNTNVNLI